MTDRTKTISKTIPSSVEYLEEIENLSCKIAGKCGFTEDDIDDISIALTEMVNNAILHGNKNDPKKKVTIHFEMTAERLSIHIHDEGTGFNPEKVRDPLEPENLLAENGRGIYLVRALMDDVEYNVSDKGTEVIISKNL